MQYQFYVVAKLVGTCRTAEVAGSSIVLYINFLNCDRSTCGFVFFFRKNRGLISKLCVAKCGCGCFLKYFLC